MKICLTFLFRIARFVQLGIAHLEIILYLTCKLGDTVFLFICGEPESHSYSLPIHVSGVTPIMMSLTFFNQIRFYVVKIFEKK